MSRFPLYIFDLDGTLMDTMTVWNQMTRRFLAAFDIVATDEEIAVMDEMSFEQGSRHLRETYGLPLTVETFAARWLEIATVLYREEAKCMPHACEALSALRAQGASVVLFSQSPRSLVERTLEREGLLPLLDRLFLSGETALRKGQPGAIAEVAGLMGCTAGESAVVEDAPYAARAAQADGAFVYGFGYANGKREQLAECCDRLIDDLLALANEA